MEMVMKSGTVWLVGLINGSVLQLAADETKLKMMQEVSENFEVSLMNVVSVWWRGFIFFVPADVLWRILRSFIEFPKM